MKIDSLPIKRCPFCNDLLMLIQHTQESNIFHCKFEEYHKDKKFWCWLEEDESIRSIQIRYDDKHLSLDLSTNETIFYMVKYSTTYVPHLTEINRLSYAIPVQDIVSSDIRLAHKLETLFNFS